MGKRVHSCHYRLVPHSKTGKRKHFVVKIVKSLAYVSQYASPTLLFPINLIYRKIIFSLQTLFIHFLGHYFKSFIYVKFCPYFLSDKKLLKILRNNLNFLHLNFILHRGFKNWPVSLQIYCQFMFVKNFYILE